jgi:peptidoglycan hydrolase CwlO-like protein
VDPNTHTAKLTQLVALQESYINELETVITSLRSQVNAQDALIKEYAEQCNKAHDAVITYANRLRTLEEQYAECRRYLRTAEAAARVAWLEAIHGSYLFARTADGAAGAYHLSTRRDTAKPSTTYISDSN